MASALPVYFVVSYTRLFFIPVLLSFHLLDQFYQPGCVCQIVRLHRARIAVCLLDGDDCLQCLALSMRCLLRLLYFKYTFLLSNCQ